MKKAYISPVCEATTVKVQSIMNMSGTSGSGSDGVKVGYGGDNGIDGELHDPDVRGQYGLFDDF